MSKKDIILVGGGGHCVSCIEVIESTGEYNIIGIVDTKEKIGQKLLSYEYIGCDEDLTALRMKCENALVTIGQVSINDKRAKLYNTLLNIGYKLPVIIASTAYVSDHATIQEGTIVMHQAFVNANAKIGSNSILNSRALVEHDAIIGNHCHISTNTVINGMVEVGDSSFIGSNSCVINNVNIAPEVLIGANATVVNNIDNSGIYVGSPIKKIK